MAKKEDAAQDPKADKMKALQAAMAKIEKDFGKGSIMRMGDEHVEPVDVIPTGSIGLNAALGVGGYPRGRIIEIYGPESSGKTTLAIHAIAEAQKMGGVAAFIDAEHAFDRFYAQKLGVDVDNLWISQPDTGEQALEIADQLIRSSAIDILVVDSVAALTPKKEIEGDMGDSSVGLQARLMSQALRKLTGTISKTNTCCIFINQLREKIGVMFGSPETTTGGNALKFYSSVRLDIRRISSIKNGDQVIGNQVRVKVVKNKVAPPFRKTEFDIMFGEGISKAGEIIDLGVTYNIIKKSGSWFSYKDTRLAQGRDATKRLLQDNPELCEELEALIMQAITNPSEEQKVAASTASKTNVGDSIEGSEAYYRKAAGGYDIEKGDGKQVLPIPFFGPWPSGQRIYLSAWKSGSSGITMIGFCCSALMISSEQYFLLTTRRNMKFSNHSLVMIRQPP